MKIIKELAEIITKGTKTFTQIGKNDSAYLYEVTDSDPNNTNIYFEVFFRRLAKAKTFPNGKKVPNRVLYPNNEAFGNWAYCIHRGNDYDTAKRIATYRFNFMDEYMKEQTKIKQSA